MINSIDPDIVLVGTNNVQLDIKGHGFGTSPTVNLPSGVTKSAQGSTDTEILITVSASINAQISPNSITVTNTATNLTSDKASFMLDGPFDMVVQSDNMGLCDGCSSAVERLVNYQVMNLSGTHSGAVQIGEAYTPAAGWNCTQQEPTTSIEPCSSGYVTDSTGRFTDGWSIGADGYTPTGCGETGNNVDEWQWCPTSPATPIGKLTGWVRTNKVSINGYVNPPYAMSLGTVINP